MSGTSANGRTSLSTHDPELYDIIQKEMARQFRGLELIASENLTSQAVMECLGSALTNKYAEGEVGCRYYGGTRYVDEVESLAKQRSLAAFGLNADEWGVSVQPYSGSPANFATYTGLLRPHDRIMGLDLPSGGHLTHGFYTGKKKISATSLYFESLPYHIDAEGVIDYEEMERNARLFQPALIILGASAYTRDYDFARVRALCNELDCLLMMDMAHTAGLIAGRLLTSPFPFCDVVTTTTHKSLRGPRSGLIFYQKKKLDGSATDFETKIQMAVFPGLQGGPHMHQIAAIATQMKEVLSPEWPSYAKAVCDNAAALAAALLELGYTLVGHGTVNHCLLWNVRVAGTTGAKMEKLLDALGISVNKNAIPGDKSALSPGGIRLGTSAITTRRFVPSEMKQVANFLHRAAELAVKVQKEDAPKTAKDFLAVVMNKHRGTVEELKAEVVKLATSHHMPGFDPASLKYAASLPE